MHEAGGRPRPRNGQTNRTREERCHFPFWYKDRLRYECVKLDASQTIQTNVYWCATLIETGSSPSEMKVRAYLSILCNEKVKYRKMPYQK